MMITLILLIGSLYGCRSTELDQHVSLSPPCDSYIYCYGPLLHDAQMSGIFNDSKEFVDMRLQYSPNETMTRFMEMKKNPSFDLSLFISNHFKNDTHEFEEWKPTDWNLRPNFINYINDTKLQLWAMELNLIWKQLGRKINDDVRLNPKRYSIIYVPNPIIVPGGRFREIYYWDSYWVIRGLLMCEMKSTVKGMLINYVSMINTFGHIPNGGRIYYTKRSQPPMMLPMVHSYVEATHDMQFVAENIDTLEQEFTYWITDHTVDIRKHGITYTLARYKDSSSGPRPESYREDITKASIFKTDNEKEEFYSELKAGAESGWDFSSRWFVNNGTNKGNITNLKTRYIIPVELNALIFWEASILREFYEYLNMSDKAIKYENLANRWRVSLTAILWNETIGSWLDYDMINEIHRNYFFPTNISPLWTGCYEKNKTTDIVSQVTNYLKTTGVLNYGGGIPTTLQYSNEQWDMPNAWPPLQYIVIMALDNSGVKEAQSLATKIADKWMKTNYKTFLKNQTMFEKYNVEQNGSPGKSTGEYQIQKGFGWTNGIILELLNKYRSTVSTANWNITSQK